MDAGFKEYMQPRFYLAFITPSIALIAFKFPFISLV